MTNGSIQSRRAVIAGLGEGVLIRGAGGTVNNFGTIFASFASQGAGVNIDSGSVTNGSASDTTALIQGYAGVGCVGAGSIVNFGQIQGFGFYGAVLFGGGSLMNGSASDSSATIEGYKGVALFAAAATNYGAIRAAGGVGAYVTDFGTITNGSTTDPGGYIGGLTGVILGTGGTLINSGTVSGADGTAVKLAVTNDILVVEAGCVFEGAVLGGGGALILNSGAGTLSGVTHGNVTVSGSMAPTSFQNFGVVTIARGATFVSSGAVSVAAGHTLNAVGVLTLGGAKAAVVNGGVIESNGGTLTVKGAVTGPGQVAIGGGLADFTSSFSQNVAFTGNTGVLELARSQSYSGTISGFSKTGGTSLDLLDIGFASAGEASYSGTKTGGMLTVTDGAHTAHIALKGDYTTSAFVGASDGHGGVIVHDPKAQLGFITAMAGFDADSGGAEQPRNDGRCWRDEGRTLATPPA